MSFKTTIAALALVLSAGAAFAQAQPATPARPAAPAAQPAAKVEPKINVNTAKAEELEALPQIGPARSKAIVENRVAAKGGAYKDMADMEKRANLPSNAVEAIKDKIRFR